MMSVWARMLKWHFSFTSMFSLQHFKWNMFQRKHAEKRKHMNFHEKPKFIFFLNPTCNNTPAPPSIRNIFSNNSMFWLFLAILSFMENFAESFRRHFFYWLVQVSLRRMTSRIRVSLQSSVTQSKYTGGNKDHRSESCSTSIYKSIEIDLKFKV